MVRFIYMEFKNRKANLEVRVEVIIGGQVTLRGGQKADCGKLVVFYVLIWVWTHE